MIDKELAEAVLKFVSGIFQFQLLILAAILLVLHKVEKDKVTGGIFGCLSALTAVGSFAFWLIVK
jgi:cell division protein FtsB